MESSMTRSRITTAIAALAIMLACTLALPSGAWALDSSALLAAGMADAEAVSDTDENSAESAAEDIDLPAPILSVENALIGKIEAVTYDGKAKTPEPIVQLDGVTLVAGQDYMLSYSSNKNAGKATVTVTGIGNYTGAKTASFTIKKASISKAKVAKIKKRTATGKVQKPKPTVKMSGKKLKVGRDYKLSYKNNKAVGTAKVVVKGKGNYKGKKVVKFKIVAPDARATARAATPAVSSGVGEVYITNTGTKFHRGTCRWLYASKIPISRAEAIAQGYEACKVCKP